jgi:Flp pilus assembly protein TadG
VTNWRSTKGAALVEFAIVVMLLLMLVFGMIEYGILISDRLLLQQAAREGVRAAAIGLTTSTVVSTVESSAPGLTITSSNITLQKQVGGAGAWVSLGDSGTANDAVFGDYVSVTVSISHSWITGLFGTSPTTITATMVERRE